MSEVAQDVQAPKQTGVKAQTKKQVDKKVQVNVKGGITDPKKVAQDIHNALNEKRAEPKEVELVQKRIFKKDKIIYHDLFKLEVAKMLKNLFWYKITPDEYVAIEHCHFFHTFDSSGKKLTNSTSVGGHFHKLELQDMGKGNPPKIISMSGPLKTVRHKDEYGKRVKIDVPVNSVDTHVHKHTYLQSDEVKLRKINSEAALLIGKNANLIKKPDDVDVADVLDEGKR